MKNIITILQDYELGYRFRGFWRNLFYPIHCFFKRYTTVKPRWLDHKYMDSCELLAHVMFEVLTEFLLVE